MLFKEENMWGTSKNPRLCQIHGCKKPHRKGFRACTAHLLRQTQPLKTPRYLRRKAIKQSGITIGATRLHLSLGSVTVIHISRQQHRVWVKPGIIGIDGIRILRQRKRRRMRECALVDPRTLSIIKAPSKP